MCLLLILRVPRKNVHDVYAKFLPGKKIRVIRISRNCNTSLRPCGFEPPPRSARPPFCISLGSLNQFRQKSGRVVQNADKTDGKTERIVESATPGGRGGMKEARIPTRFKFRKRRYLGDKLSAGTFIPGSGFLVLLTLLRCVARCGARRPGDTAGRSSFNDTTPWSPPARVRFWISHENVKLSRQFLCSSTFTSPRSVTRCLLVTTPSREASLTVATPYD